LLKTKTKLAYINVVDLKMGTKEMHRAIFLDGDKSASSLIIFCNYYDRTVFSDTNRGGLQGMA
jgi:hypothetical protein